MVKKRHFDVFLSKSIRVTVKSNFLVLFGSALLDMIEVLVSLSNKTSFAFVFPDAATHYTS